MSDDTHIIVEPISANDDGGHWTPTIGPETVDFLEKVVPENSRESVRAAAISILAKGISPTAALAGQETGLVVGYVQSGKTMSFETVATLACDNGFQIIIIVVGISIPLLNQSTDRLCRDLRLAQPDRARRWVHLPNPSNDDATIHSIRDVLDGWRDPDTPNEYKKTVLVTVLKHHQHLEKLTALIGNLDMQGVPTLLIDDEADQASLNTKVAQGRESTTYRHLMALRQALPSHTYLQYTATPQAPLLVSIIDSLSPNFVQVLEPGDAYIGGQEFFANNVRYVRVIPPEDVPVIDNPLLEPPESLLEALRVFMVGVTVGFRASHNAGNRSMLVHPSHRTDQHREFCNWVRAIFEEWKRILGLPATTPDKLALIEDFREAYDDLATTVGDLPAFKELEPFLPLAFRDTRVLEVNASAGRTPQVPWRSAYGWILVGGQAMDRGFTIEGLTVTYMPRGIGVGNADTVQQRARFFGYKKSYLEYCRLYLEQGTLNAFHNYVAHEENIRGQLVEIQRNNKPLDEWKRAFVLDRALQPCRRQVLEFDYARGRFSDDWVMPRIVLATDTVVQANREVVATFVEQLVFVDDVGHDNRTEAQRHLVCSGVLLRDLMEHLLVKMRISSSMDSHRNTGLLLQLSCALEDNPDELCTVYRMSSGNSRERGVGEDERITNLFQGAAPVHPRERRGAVYPGDHALHDHATVTIQIHKLDLTRGKGSAKRVIMSNVPVIAVWVPARLARGWVIQDQPVQDNQ